MWWLLACTANEPADQYLAFVQAGEGFEVAPRAIDSLTDAETMTGDLGTISYGGRLALGPDQTTYEGGRTLSVRTQVVDGVAIPGDLDGLLLFSFYGSLEDTVAWVRPIWEETDAPSMGRVVPLPMAWNPAVNWQFELSPADNAAYLPGTHIFLLLPDGGGTQIPLLGNRGVIAHEFGHALFHTLTVEDMSSAATFHATVDEYWNRSLHEGFADAVATLSTGLPRFIEASISMPERAVDTDAVMTGDLEPPTDDGAAAALLYDPYPLGTVLASLVWDVNLLFGEDREATFAWLVRSVRRWDPEATHTEGATPGDYDGARLLAAMLAEAPEAQQVEVCGAIQVRFGKDYLPEACAR